MIPTRPQRDIVFERPYVEILFCHPDDSSMSGTIVQREALIDTGASRHVLQWQWHAYLIYLIKTDARYRSQVAV